MAGHRFSAGWMLALSAAAAFVVGASAQEGVRAIRGVVTPDNPIWGQDPQTTPPPQEETTGRAGRGGNQAPAPRPYAQVITAAAKTDDGIFKVHRVGDTLYYEIPKAELGKDFLWVTQIKKTTIGVGYGGQAAGSRVVRWVQKGDRVLLENIDYSIIADPSDADRRGGGRRELPGDHSVVQRRGVRAVGRSGHRRHAALHDRRAGVLRAGARRRPRVRRDAVVRREGGVVPAEHQRRGHADVHRQHGRGGRGRRRPRGRARDRHARRQRARCSPTTAWSSCRRSR